MAIDPTPARAAAPVAPTTRWLLAAEVALVLGLSLGHSAADAVLGFYVRRTERPGGGGPPHPAVLYASEAPGRPLVDLARQLLDLGFAIVPVALAAYLLFRSGDGVRRTWLGGRLRWSDLVLGALVTLVVASIGLPFYLLNHDATGATVVPDTLPHVWWRIPLLVVGALHNGVLEECLLLGFLQVRLRQLGFSPVPAIGFVALLRGSYHLYQGIGGGIANLAMGLLFGWLYQRWGRVTPLVAAHTLLDAGAFLGYALLAGRVAWVPT